MKVYLDNAATTQISEEVQQLLIEINKSNYANPSSTHSFGRETRIIIENARKSIAKLLNTVPGCIFFTSGGTESDNMAINCAIKDHNISHAITTKIEHHAVLYPLQQLEKSGNIKLSYVDVNSDGLICLESLEKILKTSSRSFVSIMHANNEIGTIQDISLIGDICTKYNAIFHSDTVQTVGHYPIDLKSLNVDFIAASAHKFHGPKGIGFIYISEKIQINPLLRGGSQERNMRAGTENVSGIAALALSMDLAYKNLNPDKLYIKKLKKYMIEKLKIHIKGIEFFAKSSEINDSLYTVLSCNFPKSKFSEMLLFNLDIAGIACSGGSACSSGSVSGSHVLNEINPDSSRPGIRFSFSKYNTFEEIDYTVMKLKELYS